jgi:hypothetical protein
LLKQENLSERLFKTIGNREWDPLHFKGTGEDPVRLIMRSKMVFSLDKDPKKKILPLIISLKEMEMILLEEIE